MRQHQQPPKSYDAVVKELLVRTYRDDKELLQRTQEQPLEALLAGVMEGTFAKEDQWKRGQSQRVLLFISLFIVLVLLVALLPGPRGFFVTLAAFSVLLIPFLFLSPSWEGRRNLMRLVVLRRPELQTEHIPLLIALLDTNPLTADNYVGGNYYRVRLELCGLLPRYTEAQCRALTDKERAYLRTWLLGGNAQEKAVVLLVLATAGDEASLPQAQSLLHDSDTRVQEAAREFVESVESSYVSGNT
jgi:hypothetical protein